MLEMLLPMIAMLLQATVKNPGSIAKEKNILLHIRDLITQILEGIPSA